MAESRSRVFFELNTSADPLGRVTIELYNDKAPKTCENFRALCTGEKDLSYRMSIFHRVIDEFMLQGGDITKGDGTGGKSIYGEEFEDENIGWREIDSEGLVCMANRGKNTNNSQFFITLAPCEHLNAKHTVFGHVVSGMDIINRVSQVKVDKNDKPIQDIIIARSGELERKKKATAPVKAVKDGMNTEMSSSSIPRGRDRKRHPDSMSRSPSPSRSHGQGSRSRHRRRHRQARREGSQGSSRSPSRTPAPERDPRRNSDAVPDQTLRGRGRRRSQSPRRRSQSPSRGVAKSRSPLPSTERSTSRRSPPHSRPRSRSPDQSNQRNQYRPPRDGQRRYDDRPRESRDYQSRRDDRYRGDRYDDGRYNDSSGSSGVKYKGRGSMKYRENQGQKEYGRLG